MRFWRVALLPDGFTLSTTPRITEVILFRSVVFCEKKAWFRFYEDYFAQKKSTCSIMAMYLLRGTMWTSTLSKTIYFFSDSENRTRWEERREKNVPFCYHKYRRYGSDDNLSESEQTSKVHGINQLITDIYMCSVNQNELQIWSLQNLTFLWNSSSYLQVSYFGLCKYRVLTMLSRLAMLKKGQHAVTSWNLLQIWSSLWLTCVRPSTDCCIWNEWKKTCYILCIWAREWYRDDFIAWLDRWRMKTVPGSNKDERYHIIH